MVGLCVVKRNPQPATFFENHFFNVGGVGEGMEKAGSLFVGLPLVYSVVYFSIIIVVYFSIIIYNVNNNMKVYQEII